MEIAIEATISWYTNMAAVFIRILDGDDVVSLCSLYASVTDQLSVVLGLQVDGDPCVVRVPML